MKREFIIDGEKFDDIEGFYIEIYRLFTKDWKWGSECNLSLFDDILYGGFGVHEFKEPIKIIWKNFSKSRKDFGYEAAVKLFEEHLAICTNPERMKHITNEDDLRDIINIVKKQLQDAQNEIGETLLDIIVEIISNNKEHDRTLEIIE